MDWIFAAMLRDLFFILGILHVQGFQKSKSSGFIKESEE
jgi:hypothetical protein